MTALANLFTLLLFVTAQSGAVAPPDDAPAVVQGDGQRIEIAFVIEPIADLFMFVRSLAEQPDADVPIGLQHAVEKARELHRDLRHPLAWAHLTAALDGCTNADAIVARYEELPEEMNLPGRAEPVALRDRAVAFAQALSEAVEFFLDALWTARKGQLEAAAADLKRDLDGRAKGWDQHVRTHLRMERPQLAVNVLLTVDGPFPGAVTFRSARGEGVCFVALSSSQGMQRLETVIHEVIHALDASTTDEPTAINQMRTSLQEAGVRRMDPLMRDLPHVLIFLQAAATVRSLVDPEHVDYGESYGVYEQMGDAARIAQERWGEYLRSERDLPATIALIVSEAKAARARRGDDAALR